MTKGGPKKKSTPSFSSPSKDRLTPAATTKKAGGKSPARTYPVEGYTHSYQPDNVQPEEPGLYKKESSRSLAPSVSSTGRSVVDALGTTVDTIRQDPKAAMVSAKNAVVTKAQQCGSTAYEYGSTAWEYAEREKAKDAMFAALEYGGATVAAVQAKAKEVFDRKDPYVSIGLPETQRLSTLKSQEGNKSGQRDVKTQPDKITVFSDQSDTISGHTHVLSDQVTTMSDSSITYESVNSIYKALEQLVCQSKRAWDGSKVIVNNLGHISKTKLWQYSGEKVDNLASVVSGNDDNSLLTITSEGRSGDISNYEQMHDDGSSVDVSKYKKMDQDSTLKYYATGFEETSMDTSISDRRGHDGPSVDTSESVEYEGTSVDGLNSEKLGSHDSYITQLQSKGREYGSIVIEYGATAIDIRSLQSRVREYSDSAVDSLHSKASQCVDLVQSKTRESLDSYLPRFFTTLLDLFLHNRVIQLISRNSGGTVQIVLGARDGVMKLDAKGPLNSQAFNTLWTVVSKNEDHIYLHNQNNYIAIHEGSVRVDSVPKGSQPGPASCLRVKDAHYLVSVRSAKPPRRLLAFDKLGDLHPPTGVNKLVEGGFGVRVVSKGK